MGSIVASDLEQGVLVPLREGHNLGQQVSHDHAAEDRSQCLAANSGRDRRHALIVRLGEETHCAPAFGGGTAAALATARLLLTVQERLGGVAVQYCCGKRLLIDGAVEGEGDGCAVRQRRGRLLEARQERLLCGEPDDEAEPVWIVHQTLGNGGGRGGALELDAGREESRHHPRDHLLRLVVAAQGEVARRRARRAEPVHGGVTLDLVLIR